MSITVDEFTPELFTKLTRGVRLAEEAFARAINERQHTDGVIEDLQRDLAAAREELDNARAECATWRELVDDVKRGIRSLDEVAEFAEFARSMG